MISANKMEMYNFWYALCIRMLHRLYKLCDRFKTFASKRKWDAINAMTLNRWQNTKRHNNTIKCF